MLTDNFMRKNLLKFFFTTKKEG